MAMPTYDESHWPVLVVRMAVYTMTDADLEAHLARISSYFQRGEIFAVVVDAAEGDVPPLHRRRVAESIKADATRYPGLMAGTALVVRSMVQRGIMTAVQWMFPPPYPVRAFASASEAMTWAGEQINKARAIKRAV